MSEVPAGWYRDPSSGNGDGLAERYWDGFAWSHQVRRSVAGAAVATTGPYPDVPYEERTLPRTPDGQLLAGWWARVGAALLDGLVVTPLLALAALPSLASHWDSIATWWRTGVTTHGEQITVSGDVPPPSVLDISTGPGLIMLGSMAAAGLLYVVVFLRWKGATPGKLVVGIAVRRLEPGTRLTWSAILRRAGFMTALVVAAQFRSVALWFTLAILLDCLWPLWDNSKQALHDKVAGTTVVQRRRAT